MNVIISIEGKQAIPVRALAWLTGWHFSAGEVAEALAGDLDWPQAVPTYRMDGAAVGLYERRLWANTLVDLEHLAAKELDAGQWRAACTQALPGGVFVWRDEWQQAYNQSPDGPDALLELAECADDLEDVEARTLNLFPFVPPELAALVLQGFDAPAPQAAQVAPVVETKVQREDRRLKACEDAGLVMDAKALQRLPDGVGNVASAEQVSRQAFSDDVKAALQRRCAIENPGRVIRYK